MSRKTEPKLKDTLEVFLVELEQIKEQNVKLLDNVPKLNLSNQQLLEHTFSFNIDNIKSLRNDLENTSRIV